MLSFFPRDVLDEILNLIESVSEGSLPTLSKGVLLQQDNARVHTCKFAMDAVEQNGHEVIPHPAYSPDLAPSDFSLCQTLKRLSVEVIFGRTKKS